MHWQAMAAKDSLGVLICGGAGYIGSTVAALLADAGIGPLFLTPYGRAGRNLSLRIPFIKVISPMGHC